MGILVFGETGQVARELAHAPAVTCLNRQQADLSDPAGCAAKIHEIRPEIVINAAAYTAVDAAEEHQDLAQVINGDAPGAMAGACKELDIPFLHISTDYVFDGTGKSPWQVGDAVGPLGAYGRTKLAGERAIAAVGGRYVILRTSWVFSPHGANFVKTMLRLGAERDQLSVVADQVGGPTAAADIARALLAVAKSYSAGYSGSGVYHYSGAPDVSWAAFAKEIFKQAGFQVTINDIGSDQFPTPATRPHNSRLSCTALEQDFAISRPDWRVSLSKVLAELP
ncbi:MAG: dTDP-4-dehydrorhamnose reductase [Paracoccaceae bacterium]